MRKGGGTVVPRRFCDLGLSCDRKHEIKAACGCRLRSDGYGADFKFCRFHYLNQPPGLRQKRR